MIGYFKAQEDITLQPSCVPDPAHKVIKKGDVIKLDPVKYTKGRQSLAIPVKCAGTNYTHYAYVSPFLFKQVTVCGESGLSSYDDEECINPLNAIDKTANERKVLGMVPWLGYSLIAATSITLIVVVIKRIRKNS